MARMSFPADGCRIHLAVEGSTGGTTLGLHMAADAIEHGGRVLWAAPEMPDGVRFGQLFEHLSLADSSRYHAMNLVGSLTQAVDILLQTSTALPSVSLVVLDDWCDPSGRIPQSRIKDASRLAKELDSRITLLLISKGGADAGRNSNGLNVRAEGAMGEGGFQIWKLKRPNDGPVRTIECDSASHQCRLTDEGFQQI